MNPIRCLVLYWRLKILLNVEVIRIFVGFVLYLVFVSKPKNAIKNSEVIFNFLLPENR